MSGWGVIQIKTRCYCVVSRSRGRRWSWRSCLEGTGFGQCLGILQVYIGFGTETAKEPSSTIDLGRSEVESIVHRRAE